MTTRQATMATADETKQCYDATAEEVAQRWYANDAPMPTIPDRQEVGTAMGPKALSVDEAELLDLDEMLRREASRVLEASRLGEILRREQYQPVGSYSMRTMTWRDLDFERTEADPSWARHWDLGTQLARLSWVWKLNCTHAYCQPGGADKGLYWGLRLSDPVGGPEWKVDLWTARPEEFAEGSPNRARWASLLTDEARVRILAIKKAVCGLPQYRRQILSVHIYEAVLDRGICGVAEFMAWHRKRFCHEQGEQVLGRDGTCSPP